MYMYNICRNDLQGRQSATVERYIFFFVAFPLISATAFFFFFVLLSSRKHFKYTKEQDGDPWVNLKTRGGIFCLESL